MNKKTIAAVFVLFFVALTLLSYNQISKQSIQRIAEETPGYTCPEGKPCVTCMFKGKMCDCGPADCQCGEHTINLSMCE